MSRLILASSSAQRRQLLAEAGYDFQVVPPGSSAEDVQRPGEPAPEFVVRVAQQKAADVAGRLGQTPALVVACDTVAECGGETLGKPLDAADARRMLLSLRGRRHRVVSGLCLWPTATGEPRVRVAETVLQMLDLPDEELESYVASGQWRGKAGAFGLQDRAGWIRVERGSESNVIGLPLELLAEMLATAPFAGERG